MGRWRLVPVAILTVFVSTAASLNTKDRAIGCLYGQLIGDALGSRYEFQSVAAIRDQIREDRRPTGFLPILGGGLHQITPGQITDDSEMALSLASSLIIRHEYNAAYVACGYAYWAQTKPATGTAIRNALKIDKKLPANWYTKLSFDEKEEIHRTVLERATKYNGGKLSNGCLMRISPLAIYSVNIPFEDVKPLVYAECSLTHGENDVKEAAYAYVVAIRDLLMGKSNEVHDKKKFIIFGTPEAFETALNVTKSERICGHLLTAQKMPVPVNTGKQLVFGDEEAAGYVGVALQSAFYELLHGTSFNQSLIDVISRGGETGTNSAVVGAMLGAYYGVNDLPQEWTFTIARGKPRRKFDTVDYDVNRIVRKLLNCENLRRCFAMQAYTARKWKPKDDRRQ